MSVNSYVTQISQIEEIGLDEIELLTDKIKQVLGTKSKLREFISLVQVVEDRHDPQSKYHKNSIDQICKGFGVPRSTFYRKYKKYQASGIGGIIPKKRGPKTGGSLPTRIRNRIEELRDRQLSAKTISTIISLESQRRLSESTTRYHLRRIGRSRLKRNRKPKKPIYQRFERSKPNELWQIDNVGPFYKPGKLFAYNVVDDHSRFSLAVKISDNQKTQSWIDLLEELVKQYGKPEAILHDNGSQFVSATAGGLTKKFKEFLDSHGIRSVRSRIRHPETCGKVERMQQSMQYQCRDLVFTQSIAELQEAVDAWRDFYNTARHHSSTGMTPHERYYGQDADKSRKLAACWIYEQTLINFSKE